MELKIAPGIPGTPFFLGNGIFPKGNGGGPGGNPPAPATAPSNFKSRVNRVPASSEADSQERMRRSFDFTSMVFNSLINRGNLIRLGVEQWSVVGGGFEEDRAPTANDDIGIGANPGSVWVDRTNGDVYVNVTNGSGSARWAWVSNANNGGTAIHGISGILTSGVYPR